MQDNAQLGPDGRQAEALWRTGPSIRRAVVRQAPLLAIALFLVLAARGRLAAIDWQLVLSTAAGVSWAEWAGAALATMVSFRALGQYDAAVHRCLGTGVGPGQAARSGMAAIAISQMTGLGLVTGTLTRWHLLPGLTIRQAGQVTLAVSLSFLAAWAAVSALAVLMLWPDGAPHQAVLGRAAWATLATTAMGLASACLWPRLRLGARTIALPPVRTMVRMLVLAGVDTGAAALALYIFLPDGVAPGFGGFLPAFLMALGAGLVLGTPGGIGPFELALAGLCPALHLESLAAALLCYRLVYFAAPALLSGVAVLSGRLMPPPAAAGPRPAPPRAPVRAETCLARQGCHEFLTDPASGGHWLAARAGQTLVALFDPAADKAGLPGLMLRLTDRARAEGLAPALYKAGPRTAALARRAGWRLLPLAEEYWLRPADFTLTGPARAPLRRKLRQAEAAGVAVASIAPGALTPAQLQRLAAINQTWATRQGGERGFSMGRFEGGYLQGQRLYLASVAGQVEGFVSFHQIAGEWTLDLIRKTGAAPDGLIQALIVAALADAAAAGVPRLSLAAAPRAGFGLGGRAGALLDRLTGGGAGIRQFKGTFAPHRTRLYLAARSRPGLVLAAAEIARAIRWPGPVGMARGAGDRNGI